MSPQFRSKMNSLNAFFDQVRPPVEDTLDRVLPPADLEPRGLHEAMRYSVFAGGKRLRPLLSVAGYRAFRDDWPRVLTVAAAIELIHAYSLIHDDLPAMDDDDVRRGQPSCHRKYGEAVAILAGAGLLTLAFESISREPEFPAPALLDVIGMLGQAAGTSTGMIAGQVMDLEAGGSRVDGDHLESIHRFKTGALLGTSIAVGAHLAGAADTDMVAVTAYGRCIGLAFQIVDDILDETAPSLVLGKTPGKDRRQEKATYPALHGIEYSRRMVGTLTGEARSHAARLGTSAELLGSFAEYLESRTH